MIGYCSCARTWWEREPYMDDEWMPSCCWTYIKWVEVKEEEE